MRGEEIAVRRQGQHLIDYINVDQYPSGEPVVRADTKGIDRVMLRPRSMTSLMGGLFFIESILERGNPAPELILPYVPGSRMDRLLHTPGSDMLLTAKSVAGLINRLALPRVTILDPHSNVISGLIDNCHVYRYQDFKLDNYDCIIAPDAGASDRCNLLAAHLGIPVFHAWKKRDPVTGQITGFGVQTGIDSGWNVLVYDDICDGAGTFLGLADILPTALCDLFVTHGFFTKGTVELKKRFRNVTCTDSVVIPRQNVHVVPICELLLRG